MISGTLSLLRKSSTSSEGEINVHIRGTREFRRCRTSLEVLQDEERSTDCDDLNEDVPKKYGQVPAVSEFETSQASVSSTWSMIIDT